MRNLEICKTFLDENDWSYRQLEDRPMLRMVFAGDNGSWDVFMRAGDDGLVAVDSLLDQNVPLDRRSDVAELLTRANYGNRVGGFQFNLLDGELSFHTSVDVEGAQLQAPIVKHLLYTNVVMMDKFFTAIMAVGFEGVPATSAMRSLE